MPRKPKRPTNVEVVMRKLSRAITGLELPAIEKISEAQQEDPFQVLIATLLSARTQDATTLAASTRLFRVAPTPQAMVKLSVKQIERLIKPVSFFYTKAKHVKATCELLLDQFDGRVPGTMDELLLFPGVGRKTANVVLGNAYDTPGITVDTHVGRLSRRLGWTKYTDPVKVEFALNKLIPPADWTIVSHRLIFHGRRVCFARKPACSGCTLSKLCPKVGVVQTKD